MTTSVSGSAQLRVESNGDMIVASNSNANSYVGVLVAERIRKTVLGAAIR